MTHQIRSRPQSQTRRRRAELRLGALALGIMTTVALHSLPARAQSFDLDTLMHALAQQKSGRAEFTETKTLALLDKPIVSSGELSFRAPDHFEKRTLLPKPEALVVDGDTLTFSRNGRERTLSLTQYPEIAATIESVRGTLNGERATLEEFYRIELNGSAAHWHLVLAPKQASAAKQIARITLTGTTRADGAAELEQVEIDQTNHDRTVTTITAVPPP